MMNFDEMAGEYLSSLENKTGVYNKGDMETCYVVGAIDASILHEGDSGTFGQAIGSLKRGFLVARKGWNGKGMFLFLRPFDSLPDGFVVDTMKSVPFNFKQWVKNHPSEDGRVYFSDYICLKAADGSVVNGWLASQTDMLAEDWVIVDPEK